jgi:hypothetical protein
MGDQKEMDNVRLLLAGLLLHRNDPMLPHHVAAIRERLGKPSDAQLHEMILTGKPWKKGTDAADAVPIRKYDDPRAIAEWCPIVSQRGRWIKSKKLWRVGSRLRCSENIYLKGCRAGPFDDGGFNDFAGAVWMHWGTALKCFHDPNKLAAFIEAIM